MTFPSTPLGIIVELYYSDAWQDITDYVYVRDGIRITRGRADEASNMSPTLCRLTLNNTDGRFSARNPRSALYGLIGRNTPLRVRVVEGATSSVRFIGEVSSWPVRWDVSGKDVYVPVEAAGILRRLGQGSSPLMSSMRRELSEGSTRIAYWPCEDGELATSLSSPMVGVSSMTFSGAPALASFEGFVGSGPCITMKTGKLTGRVPSYAVGAGQLHMMIQVPESGLTDDTTLALINTTGTVKQWRIYYKTGSNGSLGIQAFNSAGTSVLNTFAAWNINGRPVRLGVSLTQSGSNIEWELSTYEQLTDFEDYIFGTLAGYTLGRVSIFTIGPNKDLGDTGIGHVSVEPVPVSIDDIVAAVSGHYGETVGNRFSRLCDENGVTINVASGSTETLGVQGIDTLYNLLLEAEKTEGHLREWRDNLALAWRPNQDLYNQASVLTLDYATDGHIHPDLEPIEDDQNIRNDVTVTRKGGASARIVLDDGPLSIQDPPAGVGLYDDQVTLSLETDKQATQQASWRLHLGTHDAARYPSVSINLATAPDLIPDAALVDLSWPIQIDNLPDWLPPGPARLTVQGYEEVLMPFEWFFTFNCSPAEMFDVFEIEDENRGRLDTGGSTLAAGVDDDDTSWSVASSGARWIDSATYPDQFPLTIQCEGEHVTVTAIAGTSSPQTFTVTRAANGVARAHSAGASLRLADPVVWAL